MSGALFEREAALGAIATTLDVVRRGGPAALFVQGEAGLGKTSLIVEARSSASGLQVGWGEGVASETALPFGLLGQALGPLGALSELETVSDLASGEARASVYYRCAVGSAIFVPRLLTSCSSTTSTGPTPTRSVYWPSSCAA